MVLHILKKDLRRNKGIGAVLFIFILLSAFLAAAGSNMIASLAGSLDNLFEKARVPHFVQMHAGSLDENQITSWMAAGGFAEEYQVVRMVSLDGTSLGFNGRYDGEENSIMDISFVKQNTGFDFLLDTGNDVFRPATGEIGVPVYYMERDGLKIGDTLAVTQGRFSAEYTIAGFIRDAQMNPAMVHSKRFVLNDRDFETLSREIPEYEYLIEVRLWDTNRLAEFQAAYQESSLPKNGPAVDYTLFRMINALNDGLIAAVIILVSLLLNIIAILCLRFVMIAAIEEDYREIGVMKAIGLKLRDIKRIYLAKYVCISAAACIAGCAAAFAVKEPFTANIMVYLGAAPVTLLNTLLPPGLVLCVFAMVVFCSWLVLRRFNTLSAVEAIRSGTAGKTGTVRTKILALRKNRHTPVPLFLGLRDLVLRFGSFGLLFFVFAAASFVILVPVNFLNTIRSPSFIRYMGMGKSDIHIDIRQGSDTGERFGEVIESLRLDPDAALISPHVTGTFRILGGDGTAESINIETGDFTVFPLEYFAGKPPVEGDEIALSYLRAEELDKTIGDTLTLFHGGAEYTLTVTGIYQDITNGGRTAKAPLRLPPENTLWYTVSLGLKPGADIGGKALELSRRFPGVRVTNLDSYLSQTLGSTIGQLRLLAGLAFFISAALSVLITSLFLKMIIAKESSRIGILKSLGFSETAVKFEYAVKAVAVLILGIVLGTVFSNTAGQGLVAAAWSLMGAPGIRLVINPVQAYILCPLALLAAVSATAAISLRRIRTVTIRGSVSE
ncbi:ABC transporter permease [Breznakiella homolactica]|uniref:FtsX-like permease family protein n=1 Tax=Breznakiella homolactica TaxID=2798577 RepID=A0A7T8BA91_9SPIR|nr:FtsX-like permease family protein [Breznakiella homolactica]QQO07983.1 FtsX-like permease family protein [Breznakiella homolactica]